MSAPDKYPLPGFDAGDPDAPEWSPEYQRYQTVQMYREHRERQDAARGEAM